VCAARPERPRLHNGGDYGASPQTGLLAARESPREDLDDLHSSLPGTLEYWADPDRQGPSPFRYLTALRQNPPGIKSWG